jgi:hypothetical protein
MEKLKAMKVCEYLILGRRGKQEILRKCVLHLISLPAIVITLHGRNA